MLLVPTIKVLALIERLKAIAMENYEHGGDGFIECYDQDDWLRFVSRANGKPVTALRKSMKSYDAVRRDIENS
jgi:hypothetical protein